MNPRVAALLRRAQWTLLVLLTLWVAVHTVFIWNSGWSAWRLGGLGMYTEPTRRYAAAALVECRREGCASELEGVRLFSTRIRRSSLLMLRHDSDGDYESFDLDEIYTPGDVSERLRAFVTFPSADNARRLVTATIERPCDPYLVVRYRQRVTLLRRQAHLETKRYVVPPSERCRGPDSD